MKQHSQVHLLLLQTLLWSSNDFFFPNTFVRPTKPLLRLISQFHPFLQLSLVVLVTLGWVTCIILTFLNRPMANGFATLKAAGLPISIFICSQWLYRRFAITEGKETIIDEYYGTCAIAKSSFYQNLPLTLGVIAGTTISTGLHLLKIFYITHRIQPHCFSVSLLSQSDNIISLFQMLCVSLITIIGVLMKNASNAFNLIGTIFSLLALVLRVVYFSSKVIGETLRSEYYIVLSLIYSCFQLLILIASVGFFGVSLQSQKVIDILTVLSAVTLIWLWYKPFQPFITRLVGIKYVRLLRSEGKTTANKDNEQTINSALIMKFQLMFSLLNNQLVHFHPDLESVVLQKLREIAKNCRCLDKASESLQKFSKEKIESWQYYLSIFQTKRMSITEEDNVMARHHLTTAILFWTMSQPADFCLTEYLVFRLNVYNYQQLNALLIIFFSCQEHFSKASFKLAFKQCHRFLLRKIGPIERYANFQEISYKNCPKKQYFVTSPSAKQLTSEGGMKSAISKILDMELFLDSAPKFESQQYPYANLFYSDLIEIDRRLGKLLQEIQTFGKICLDQQDVFMAQSPNILKIQQLILQKYESRMKIILRLRYFRDLVLPARTEEDQILDSFVTKEPIGYAVQLLIVMIQFYRFFIDHSNSTSEKDDIVKRIPKWEEKLLLHDTEQMVALCSAVQSPGEVIISNGSFKRIVELEKDMTKASTIAYRVINLNILFPCMSWEEAHLKLMTDLPSICRGPTSHAHNICLIRSLNQKNIYEAQVTVYFCLGLQTELLAVTVLRLVPDQHIYIVFSGSKPIFRTKQDKNVTKKYKRRSLEQERQRISKETISENLLDQLYPSTIGEQIVERKVKLFNHQTKIISRRLAHKYENLAQSQPSSSVSHNSANLINYAETTVLLKEMVSRYRPFEGHLRKFLLSAIFFTLVSFVMVLGLAPLLNMKNDIFLQALLSKEALLVNCNLMIASVPLTLITTLQAVNPLFNPADLPFLTASTAQYLSFVQNNLNMCSEYFAQITYSKVLINIGFKNSQTQPYFVDEANNTISLYDRYLIDSNFFFELMANFNDFRSLIKFIPSAFRRLIQLVPYYFSPTAMSAFKKGLDAQIDKIFIKTETEIVWVVWIFIAMSAVICLLVLIRIWLLKAFYYDFLVMSVDLSPNTINSLKQRCKLYQSTLEKLQQITVYQLPHLHQRDEESTDQNPLNGNEQSTTNIFKSDSQKKWFKINFLQDNYVYLILFAILASCTLCGIIKLSFDTQQNKRLIIQMCEGVGELYSFTVNAVKAFGMLSIAASTHDAKLIAQGSTAELKLMAEHPSFQKLLPKPQLSVPLLFEPVCGLNASSLWFVNGKAPQCPIFMNKMSSSVYSTVAELQMLVNLLAMKMGKPQSLTIQQRKGLLNYLGVAWNNLYSLVYLTKNVIRQSILQLERLLRTQDIIWTLFGLLGSVLILLVTIFNFYQFNKICRIVISEFANLAPEDKLLKEPSYRLWINWAKFAYESEVQFPPN